jgi:N-acetylglucosamine-6-phosphate deacetylase
MNMNKIFIRGVRLVTAQGLTSPRTVFIENGRIVNIADREAPVSAGARGNEEAPDSDDWTKVEGEGQILIPGMIDVHIHGANGFDMMDGTLESVMEVSKVCARTGCTSFLATSVSSSLDDLLQMIRSVRQAVGKEGGASIGGIHLEGPYLHPKRKGMQNEQFLRHPDLEEMSTILQHAGPLVKMVTLAPELPGALELIIHLRSEGIIVSVAHSDATYEQAQEAFTLGASHVTHCFNGMRPIHHRDPGLVVAALENPYVSLQAIVDQIHLHPAIVRLMYREKGRSGMVLITDALQAMGLGDGMFRFGGHDVLVEEGVARLNDGTLASSTVTMNLALKNAVDCGIPLYDAVTMATRTPADILGWPTKGRIEPGADADLVLLDDEFNVLWTMVGGEFRYQQ